MLNLLPKQRTGILRPVLVSGLSVLLIVGIAKAVTTLSENIDTEGNLSVDGSVTVLGDADLGDVEGGTTFLTLDQTDDEIDIYATSIELEVGGEPAGSISITGDALGDDISIGNNLEDIVVNANTWDVTAAGGASFDTVTIGGGDDIDGHFSDAVVTPFLTGVPANSCEEETVDVTEADLGDSVVATPDPGVLGILTDISWNAYVSDIDKVTVRLCNPTVDDSPPPPGPLTWILDVWSHAD
jgi:hypothetical protein